MAASLQVRRKAGPRGSERSGEPRGILLQEGPEVASWARGWELGEQKGGHSHVLETPALTLTDPRLSAVGLICTADI